MYQSVISNKLSRMTGSIANLKLPYPISLWAVKTFASSFNINVSEAELPLKDYKSFNAFFTRNLKSDCRHIENESATLVSPVDGKISNFGPITNNKLIQAKGIEYNLENLIGKDKAADYQDGFFLTIYLAPSDCHRIFMPIDGQIEGYRHIPGRLFPVRKPYIDTTQNLFIINERLISFINSKLGKIAVVKVGAFNVGSMSLAYDDSILTNKPGLAESTTDYKECINMNKGDHLATFHLGSTIVLLLENKPWVQTEYLNDQQAIQYGQPILKLN